MDSRIAKFTVWILAGLAVFSVLLVVCYIKLFLEIPDHDEWFPRLFDLDGEQNLCAWFATILWFCAGLASFFAFWAETTGAQTRKASSFWWCCIGLGFVFLSLDELAEVHEHVGSYFLKMLKGTSYGDIINSFVPDSPWLFFYIPPMILLAIFNVWFLWVRMHRKWQLLALLAGAAIAFPLAVGNEYYQSMPADKYHAIAKAMHLHSKEANRLSIMIEETAENVAVCCVALAFFSYACQLIVDRRVSTANET